MGQFKRKMHVTDRIAGSLYIGLKAEDNSRIVLHGVSWAPMQSMVPFSETGEEQICVTGS